MQMGARRLFRPAHRYGPPLTPGLPPDAVGANSDENAPAIQSRLPARQSRLPAIPSRLPAIQGLRAIAVLMVVAFHAGLPLPGGFVGVDVFFVISGFVITAMLHREWTSTGRIRFGRFYARRFRRLAPALALVVAATVIFSALILSPLGPQQTTALTAFGAMTGTANFVIAMTTGGYFDAPAETNPLLHTWSLSVEEQFYVVFPLLLALAWGLSRRWDSRAIDLRRIEPPELASSGRASSGRGSSGRGSGERGGKERGPRAQRSPERGDNGISTLLAVVAVLAVLLPSLGLSALAASGVAFPGSRIVLGFYSPFTRSWEFAVGALVALAVGTGVLSGRRGISLPAASIGAAMLAASTLAISGGSAYRELWMLLPVTGTALLIIGVTSSPNVISRVLSTSAPVRIGDWSYSIYLWHWPLIVFAGILWPDAPAAILVAAALSLIPAILSYVRLEQPLRQRPLQPASRMVRFVAVTMLAPVLVAASSLAIATQVWAPIIGSDVTATPPGYALGCHFSPGGATSTPGVCQWNDEAAGSSWNQLADSPVYLVGDSNAAHYTDGLIGATAMVGRPLSVSTASECPFIAVDIHLPDPAATQGCVQYQQATSEWLATAPPGLVVIANSDSYWLDDTTQVNLPGQEPTGVPAEKVRTVEPGLTETITRLQSRGHRVLTMQTLPHWTGPYEWDPTTCTLVSTLNGCVETMPLAFSQTRSADVRQALADTGRQTSTTVGDLSPDVCPEDTCFTSRDELWTYRDEQHLTNDMSARLADPLARLIS